MKTKLPVFLFYGTVKDNILFSKPGATDEDVYRAAKVANAVDGGQKTVIIAHRLSTIRKADILGPGGTKFS